MDNFLATITEPAYEDKEFLESQLYIVRAATAQDAENAFKRWADANAPGSTIEMKGTARSDDESNKNRVPLEPGVVQGYLGEVRR